MKDIGLVPVDCLPYVWAETVELIQLHGQEWLKEIELKEIYCGLLDGTLELWVAGDSIEIEMVLVGGWERHAKRAYYHIMWVGGSGLKKHLKQGLELIEESVCLRGAYEVVFGGRAGWLKLMRKYGYHPAVQMRKDVRVLWRN